MAQGHEPMHDPVALLKHYGAELVSQNGHNKWRLGGQIVVLSHKPSGDWRADKNSVALIRRIVRDQGLTPPSRQSDRSGQRPQDVPITPVAGPEPLFFAPPAAVAEPTAEPPTAPIAEPEAAPKRRHGGGVPKGSKLTQRPCPVLTCDQLVGGRHLEWHKRRGELPENFKLPRLSTEQILALLDERTRPSTTPLGAPAPAPIPPPAAVPEPAGQVEPPPPPRELGPVPVTMLASGPVTRSMKALIEELPPIPYALALKLVPALTLAADQETELRLLREQHDTLAKKFETLRATFGSIERAEVITRIRS